MYVDICVYWFVSLLTSRAYTYNRKRGIHWCGALGVYKKKQHVRWTLLWNAYLWTRDWVCIQNIKRYELQYAWHGQPITHIQRSRQHTSSMNVCGKSISIWEFEFTIHTYTRAYKHTHTTTFQCRIFQNNFNILHYTHRIRSLHHVYYTYSRNNSNNSTHSLATKISLNTIQ